MELSATLRCKQKILLLVSELAFSLPSYRAILAAFRLARAASLAAAFYALCSVSKKQWWVAASQECFKGGTASTERYGSMLYLAAAGDKASSIVSLPDGLEDDWKPLSGADQQQMRADK